MPLSIMTTTPKAIGIYVGTNEGILSNLPREVRDEIYRCLVVGSYLVSPMPRKPGTPKFKAPGDPGFQVNNADFSILRVSKSISEEAKEILYSESIFNFHLDFFEDGCYTRISKEVSDRMMKLKYHIRRLYGPQDIQFSSKSSSQWYLKNVKSICQITIDHFTGTNIMRHSIQIVLFSTTALETTFTNPLFQVLRSLGGFPTVTIELDPLLRVRKVKTLLLPVIDYSKEDMMEEMQAIETLLKPALGPAEHFISPDNRLSPGHLSFYPHQHLSNKLDSEEKRQGRAL